MSMKPSLIQALTLRYDPADENSEINPNYFSYFNMPADYRFRTQIRTIKLRRLSLARYRQVGIFHIPARPHT
jgi:hypothetical protein